MRTIILVLSVVIFQSVYSQENSDTMLVSKTETFSQNGELTSMTNYEYDVFNNCIRATSNNYPEQYETTSIAYYNSENRWICRAYYENQELVDSSIFNYKENEVVEIIEYRNPKTVLITSILRDEYSFTKVTLEIEDKTPENYKPSQIKGAESPQFLSFHRTIEIEKFDDQNRPIEIFYYYVGDRSSYANIGEKPYLDSLQMRVVFKYYDNQNKSVKKEYSQGDSIAYQTTIFKSDSLKRPVRLITYKHESDSMTSETEWEYQLNLQGLLTIYNRSSIYGSYTIEIQDSFGRTVEYSSITDDGFILSKNQYTYNESGYLVEEIYYYYANNTPINAGANFETYQRTVHTYQ